MFERSLCIICWNLKWTLELEMLKFSIKCNPGAVPFLVSSTCQGVLLQCNSMLGSAPSVPFVTYQTSFTMPGFDFLVPTPSNFVASCQKNPLERWKKVILRTKLTMRRQSKNDLRWMIPEWSGHETIPATYDPFSELGAPQTCPI